MRTGTRIGHPVAPAASPQHRVSLVLLAGHEVARDDVGIATLDDIAATRVGG